MSGNHARADEPAKDPDPDPRLERWERRTRRPQLVLALVFLVAWGLPILWEGMPVRAADLSRLISGIVWFLFALDYVIRLIIARDTWRFFKSNIFDLFVVVLPILRPLGVLRAVTVIGLVAKRTQGSSRVRTTVFVLGAAFAIALVAALGVTEAESGNPNASIDGINDALWWAITTMTTVGYGDTVPVSPGGRIAGVMLMFTGVALVGVITASLAGWFMEQSEAEDPNRIELEHQLRLLTGEVSELRAEIRSLLGESDGHRPDGPTAGPDDTPASSRGSGDRSGAPGDRPQA